MLSLSCRTLARSVAARGKVASGLASRGYHEKIVEHYENPRNVGSLDKNDGSVGTVSRPTPFNSMVLLSCWLVVEYFL